MLWIISVVSLIMLNDIAVNAPTSKTPEKEHVLVLKMLDYNIDVLFILPDMHTIILFLLLGASHLWPIQQAYITQLAKIQSANTKTSFSNTLNLFFGIFFGLFYTCTLKCRQRKYFCVFFTVSRKF